MSEALRHQRQGQTAGEHQRRRAVPKVMKPHRPHPSLDREGAEALRDPARLQWAAVLAGEHIGAVLVRLAPRGPLHVLGEPMGQQDSDERRPDVDPPPLAGLGLGDLDHEHAPLQVYVRPTQRERLATAQPGHREQLKEWGQPIPSDVIKERAQLGRFPGPDLGPLGLRQLDELRSVVRDDLGFHGGGQCRRQRGVHPSDRHRPRCLLTGRNGPVHGRDVTRPQVPQPVPAQVRDEVLPDVLPVGPRGRGAQPGPHLRLNPFGQPLLQRLALVRVVLAGCHPGQQLAQCFLGGVTVGVPAAALLLPLPVRAEPEVGDIRP